MREELSKFASGVFLLLVGTALGYVVQNKRAEADAAIRYLDFEAEPHPALLSRPDIDGRRLEVTLDGQAINNISELTVTVQNYSDRNFDNVPFYLDLYNEDGTTPQLLRQTVVGTHALASAVDTLPQPTGSSAKEIHFAYNVKTANHQAVANVWSTNDNAVFKASYLV